MAKDEIVTLLAGGYAEARSLRDSYRIDLNDPRSSDEAQIVGRVVLLEDSMARQDELITALGTAAANLVTGHWREIERVAADLLGHGTLGREGVLKGMGSEGEKSRAS